MKTKKMPRTQTERFLALCPYNTHSTHTHAYIETHSHTQVCSKQYTRMSCIFLCALKVEEKKKNKSSYFPFLFSFHFMCICCLGPCLYFSFESFIASYRCCCCRCCCCFHSHSALPMSYNSESIDWNARKFEISG